MNFHSSMKIITKYKYTHTHTYIHKGNKSVTHKIIRQKVTRYLV